MSTSEQGRERPADCPRLTGRVGGAAGTSTGVPPNAGSKTSGSGALARTRALTRIWDRAPGHRRGGQDGMAGLRHAHPDDPQGQRQGVMGGVEGTLLGAGPLRKQGLSKPQQTKAVPGAEAGVAQGHRGQPQGAEPGPRTPADARAFLVGESQHGLRGTASGLYSSGAPSASAGALPRGLVPGRVPGRSCRAILSSLAGKSGPTSPTTSRALCH